MQMTRLVTSMQWNELLLTDRYYNLKVKIYLHTKYVRVP